MIGVQRRVTGYEKNAGAWRAVLECRHTAAVNYPPDLTPTVSRTAARYLDCPTCATEAR